ncbi:MAG TPA: hypothetical protein VD886_10690 [Herpetosiphonaceae bacterium]|nr:hypothetical protein [Herpetosiphonaceae bacterium]
MSKQRERWYRAVIAVLLIGTAVLLIRVYALNHAQGLTYYRMSQGMVGSWYQAHDHLGAALDPLTYRPIRLAPARALELAEQDLLRAELASTMYGTVLDHGFGEFSSSTMLGALMVHYANEIRAIRLQLADTVFLTPPMIESLTLLRADLESLMALLPTEVLREANRPTVTRILNWDLRRTLLHPVARQMLGTGN